MVTDPTAILEQGGTRQRSKQRKPFIVDAPAPMLRRSTELSKNARALYMTMRAMADGKTGQLRIGRKWLPARAIDSAAEMCRDNRLRAMRELVALHLVTIERERVLRIIRGRKRVVLGRTRYTVHKPNFLLQSISSTIEEIDLQDLPNPPTVPSDFGCRSGFESRTGGYAHSSSKAPQKNGDDDEVCDHTDTTEEESKDKIALLRIAIENKPAL